MSKDYTILVNSTDSFEDCWQPFFKLLAHYWPNCQQQIVLNTETKDFHYDGLNIRASKTGAHFAGRKSAWGECMAKCLDSIDTDIILYFQEDYFLNGPVDVSQIEEFVGFMQHNGTTCIGLTHFHSPGPYHLSEHPLLWDVDRCAKYRISLQASLWNRHKMLQHMKKNESPWEFEVKGSLRARQIDDSILVVNKQVFGESRKHICPYIGTGIIRGKWNRDAVEGLFQEHDIPTDFTLRGFYAPPPPVTGPVKRRNFIKRSIRSLLLRFDEAMDRVRYLW